MKSLITGCAGFAGSHLSEYLLTKGEDIIALVRSQDHLHNIRHLLPHIRTVYADILDSQRIGEILRETRPQRIYHLAALSSPAQSFGDPFLAYQTNFQGTFNLLCALREAQLDSRFLLASSSQVYGQVSEGDLPVREDSPLKPASPYAGSKSAAELLALQFFESYGLSILRVRAFNHTGPRQDSHYVCSGLARQVAEIELGVREPQVRAGNLKARRDFSDVRDIVRGYYLVLEKGQAGEVYQLCSGRAVSIETILKTLTGLTSKRIETVTDESKLRSRDAPAIWGDPSKSMALGWTPRYELQTTLRDLKHWWEDSVRAERAMAMPSRPSGLASC